MAMQGSSLDRTAHRGPIRRWWHAAAVVVCAVLMNGCGGGTLALFYDDCDDAMAAARRELGEPERIVTDRVDDLHIVVFGYWYIGMNRRFEWATYQECEVTDTRYPPQERPAAAAVGTQ